MEDKLLQNLENVGLNGVLLIFLFGVYKLLVSRNFISRCGFITVDFRSKELRAQELEYKHIERLSELELEKMKCHTNSTIDNYLVTDKEEHDNHLDKNQSTTNSHMHFHTN